jgi:hypothetical protein
MAVGADVNAAVPGAPVTDHRSAYALPAAGVTVAPSCRQSPGYDIVYPDPDGDCARIAAINAIRAEIAAGHQLCLARRQAMDVFSEPYRARPGSPARIVALTGHPAFRALVADFADAFTQLTAAVDAALNPQLPANAGRRLRSIPWRDLITDEQLLAALDDGIEAECQHILALAAARFLSECDPSSSAH